jgi:hypothetical protein
MTQLWGSHDSHLTSVKCTNLSKLRSTDDEMGDGIVVIPREVCLTISHLPTCDSELGDLLLRERPGEHFSGAVGPGTIVQQYFFIRMIQSTLTEC